MSFRQITRSFAAHFTSLFPSVAGKNARRLAAIVIFLLPLTSLGLEAQTVHFDNTIRLNSSISIHSSGNVERGTSSFEAVRVGSASPTVLSLQFRFDAEGTLGSTAVLTKGAKSLDFTDARSGTCKAGSEYAANATCTVNVTFKPRAPGLRFGAVQLLDSHGKPLAIANLSGIGTEPQPNFLPASVFSRFGVGLFATATSVAVDGSGNLFIADQGNDTEYPAVPSAVYKVLAVDGSIPASPTINALGSGFSNPSGVALDGSGNIYVADTGNQVVELMPAGCADTHCVVATIGSGFAAPSAVAVDGSGNVFVTDSTNNAVYEILAGCTSTSCTTNRLASSFGFNNPNGVAVDGSGNVFVADTGNGAIEEIVAVGGKIPATDPTVRTLATGFDEPWGIAVMANGSLLGSDAYQQLVFEILAVDGSITADSPAILALKGPTTPLGIALDGKGNAFIADYGEDEEATSSVYIAELAANPSIAFPTPTPAFTVDSTDGQPGLIVVNGGNATLTSEGPGLTAPAANFTLVPGSGTPPDCTASFSLAPGGACNLNIEFAPVDAGSPLSATVVLTDNSLGATKATQTISLSGVGTAPVIVLSPSSLPEGTLGTAYSQTITASGGPPSFSYSYAVTAGSLPPGLTLSTGGALSGTPTENGSFSFAVTATGSSSGTEAFSGSQAYVVAIFANLGIVSVGSASTTATSVILTVQKSGTLGSIAALTLGASGLDFSNAGGGTCTVGTSYTAGNTCTVKLAFKPLAPGLRRGAVQLLTASGTPLATTYVQGTGYGPRVNFLSSTLSNLGSGFNTPAGVAEDGHGNIFVVDGANAALYELKAGCTPSACTILTLNSSFLRPNRVAVDGSGNIFVADAGAGSGGYGALYELLAGCTPAACTVLNLGSDFNNTVAGITGFYAPTGVAVDGSGNIFLTDAGNPGGGSAVFELQTGCTPSACTVLTLNTSLGFPQDVAVDGNGNLFVTSYGGFAELLAPCTPAACTVNSLGSFSSPLGVATDGSGNVFVTDTIDNALYEMLAVDGSVPISSPTTLTLASGFNSPLGLMVDASGNALVADTLNSRVAMLNMSTPPSVNFPTPTAVGSVDTADGSKTVKVIDGGNAPLLFSVPSSGVNPSYPTNFPANASDKNLCSSATPLAMNATCDVSVSLEPSVAGANSGSVVLTDNTLNQTKATQSIALSGTGKGVSTQTISFHPTTPVTFGVSPITLVATGGASGNPVTFTLVSGPGSLSGTDSSVLTVTGVGTIVIAANQAGNASYSAAAQVTQSIVVETPPVAALNSPASGSTLAGPSVTFNWSAISGGNGYFLHLGTTGAGSLNLLNSPEYSKTTTSVTVNNLPVNGETIYARLFTDYNGTHFYQDYTFKAAAQAELTLPGTSGTLAGPTAKFGWSAATGTASGYFLHLGTTGAGSLNLLNSAEYPTSTTSVTINNLPVNGETIYARIYTDYNGTHLYQDYIFTASAQAALTLPATSGTFAGPTVTFGWSAATGTINGYFLHLGTTGAGSENLLNSAEYPTSTTSVTLNNLPLNGETIYARLFTDYNGTHLYKDYTFTAAGQALLTSPLQGATLSGATVTFDWSTATGSVRGYFLHLGTTGAGALDLLNSAEYSTSTNSVTVNDLPVNGKPIYARIFTDYNGIHAYQDYVFTAQ